jgi:flagellar basal-body rod modification protein FlgD
VTPIPTITSTTPTVTQKPEDEKSTKDAGTLGKDDFLRLLVAQLQHQDPMNPMDNAEYMGQLASFSTLEQITNVGDEIKLLRTGGQVDQAVSLIGKSVEYMTAEETPATGVVDSVRIVEGEIILSVGGQDVSPSAITAVTDVPSQ